MNLNIAQLNDRFLIALHHIMMACGIAINEKRFLLGVRIPRVSYLADHVKRKAAAIGENIKWAFAFSLVSAVAVA